MLLYSEMDTPLAIQNSEPIPEHADAACDAKFYYETSGESSYAFSCSFADGRPGVVKRFDCISFPICQTIIRKGRPVSLTLTKN